MHLECAAVTEIIGQDDCGNLGESSMRRPSFALQVAPSNLQPDRYITSMGMSFSLIWLSVSYRENSIDIIVSSIVQPFLIAFSILNAVRRPFGLFMPPNQKLLGLALNMN
jgi:hypothetical protein